MVRRDRKGRIYADKGRPGQAAKRVEARVLYDAQTAVRRVEIRAFQTLTSATPVDTGFARANWTPSTGSATAAIARGPKSKLEARRSATTLLPQNQAKAIGLSKSYQLEQGKAFLTNPVPYINALNEGSSAQAPKKFVERAIEVAVRSLPPV